MHFTNSVRERIARRLYNWSLKLTVVDADEDFAFDATPVVFRRDCELRLVTDCEVYTRTVQTIDGRECCPTCATVIPDMIASTCETCGAGWEDCTGALNGCDCQHYPSNPITEGALNLIGRALDSQRPSPVRRITLEDLEALTSELPPLTEDF